MNQLKLLTWGHIDSAYVRGIAGDIKDGFTRLHEKPIPPPRHKTKSNGTKTLHPMRGSSPSRPHGHGNYNDTTQAVSRSMNHEFDVDNGRNESAYYATQSDLLSETTFSSLRSQDFSKNSLSPNAAVERSYYSSAPARLQPRTI